MSSKLKAAAPATLVALFLLVGCGGGGGYTAPAPTTPTTPAPPPPDPNVAGTDIPTVATTSVSAEIAFAQSDITARTNETANPLVVGDATTLATDDMAEPSAV